MVKALRYYSDGPGIDSRWCHWGFFPWLPLTEPCALGSTQPLNMSTRDFSWGKGGQCVWLMTYHPCSAKRHKNPGPEPTQNPLGLFRPVAGWPLLYFTTRVISWKILVFMKCANNICFLTFESVYLYTSSFLSQSDHSRLLFSTVISSQIFSHAQNVAAFLSGTHMRAASRLSCSFVMNFSVHSVKLFLSA